MFWVDITGDPGRDCGGGGGGETLDMGGNVACPDHPQSTKLGAVVWITGLDVASPQNRARGELGTISIW